MTMHARTPERVGSSVGGPGRTHRMPDMDALYSRLAEADEHGDAKALAALAWELYGLLELDEGDLNSLGSGFISCRPGTAARAGDAHRATRVTRTGPRG